MPGLALCEPTGRRGRRRSVLLALTALLVPGVGTGVVLTPTALASDSAAERKAEVDGAAESARADLEVSDAHARAAADALRRVEAELGTARAEVAAAEALLATSAERDRAAAEELARAEEELARAVAEEAVAVRRVAEQERLVGDRANAAYRSGGQMQRWQVVLDSDDAEQMLSRLDYLSSVAGADNRLLDDLTAARVALAEVAAERAVARQRVAELREQARQALERDRQAVLDKQAAEARVNALVTQQREAHAAAERQRAEDQALIQRLEAESRALEAQLAELARQAKERAAQEAAQAAARAEQSSRSRTAPAPPVSVQSQPGSSMTRPIASIRPTSNFGMRNHPIYGEPRMHNGVDFGAPTGTTVVAALSGRVVTAGLNGGAGNMITLDHGIVAGRHMTTLYMHLSRIDVRPGASVGRGQRIGAVGSTGASTGPHLHFEVRLDGSPVNPLGYL